MSVITIWRSDTKTDWIAARENVQSTLVISKSKWLSKILRNIHSSTYQICRIEDKVNKCKTTFHHDYVIKLLKLYRYWKYCGKEEKLLLLFSTIFCYLLLDFRIKTWTRFSLRVKRLFEISEVDITRVDCTSSHYAQRSLCTTWVFAECYADSQGHWENFLRLTAKTDMTMRVRRLISIFAEYAGLKHDSEFYETPTF